MELKSLSANACFAILQIFPVVFAYKKPAKNRVMLKI